jgi:hypothetical protein
MERATDHLGVVVTRFLAIADLLSLLTKSMVFLHNHLENQPPSRTQACEPINLEGTCFRSGQDSLNLRFHLLLLFLAGNTGNLTCLLGQGQRMLNH